MVRLVTDTLGIDGPPRRMGRYELLFRIASGGMAEVYAARVVGEGGFEKLVAVKRMLPTLAEDEEFVQMFLDEARVAANISNAHVVQTLDLGRDSTGALYIVMDLVVGVTLSRILKEAAKVRRAVPVGMAVELLAQAASGLHAAHDATTPIGEPLHIVHRDVSPQNILVGVDGRVRITDFGVARAVARATQTQAGRIKGKFAYCSPEQLRGSEVDRRADVFALGVVAWETLAGQRLFVADHPLAIMERVQNMPILPVCQVRSRVPESVSAVIDRALERDPDGRFPTAGAFATELRRAARDAGLEAPEQAEARRFVRGAGGEPLRKIRANIQTALSLGDDQSMDVEITETLSDISQSLTVDTDTDMDGPRRLDSSADVDASAVHAGPSSLFPPPPGAPPEPEAPDRRLLFGALGLAAVALVGLGAFFGLQSPEPIVDEPVSAPPLAIGQVGAEADSDSESDSDADNGEPTADSEHREPNADTENREPNADAENREPNLDSDDREPSTDSEPATPTRRRAPMRATPMAETPMTATAMTEPTEAPPPTMTEMATPSSMGGLLMGIDDFDRAAGQ